MSPNCGPLLCHSVRPLLLSDDTCAKQYISSPLCLQKFCRGLRRAAWKVPYLKVETQRLKLDETRKQEIAIVLTQLMKG